jgi:Fusaric acid resistance protein-like
LNARSQAPELTRSSWTLNLSGFSVQEGLRAGLSVAAIVVLHAWLDFPLLLLTALGALLTCLADSSIPGQGALRPLLAFAVLGALLGMLFGWARTQGLWCAVPLAGLAIALCSFGRVYGPAAMQVGNMLSVWIVISLDDPVSDWPAALQLGGMFLAGSLWALLLTTVLWRIQPGAPVQRAVADCYRTLAAMTEDMRRILAAAPTPEAGIALWDRQARTLRRAARDAIETARMMLMVLARAHGLGAPRVARAWLRLEAADQVLGALIGVSVILEGRRAGDAIVARRVLRHLRAVLLVLAHSMELDTTPDMPRLTQSLAGIRTDVSGLPETEALRRLIVAITERLAVATTLTVPANLLPGSLPDGRSSEGLATRLLEPVRSNMTWASAALRHATMAGTAGAIGLAFTLSYQHEYERWLVITMLMTMQPYFSMTWQRMIERIAATVLGGLIAAAMGLVLHTPLAVSLVMFPLSVFAFTVRRVSFALFLSALTPMIILLVESGVPGASEFGIAVMRALYTVLGGLLAVACSLVMWPGRQPQRAVRELREAIAANAGFADAVMAQLLGEVTAEVQSRARRQAGLASNALEAALSRGMLEPRLVGSSGLNATLTVDAALRRVAGRLSAVLSLFGEGDQTVTLPAADLRAWRQWIADSAAAILRGAAPEQLPPRPAMSAEAGAPGLEGFARIARQIELIAGAMPRVRA